MSPRSARVAFVLVAVLVACSTPSRRPSPRDTSPGEPPAAPAPAPDDVVDRGTLITFTGETIHGKETFTIRRAGDHLIIRTAEAAVVEPEWHHSEGEIEVDAQYRPVRAEYVKQTPAQEYTYRLAGSPATLDVTRNDDRNPQKVVASRALDVYVEGPGFIGMTALCRVRGDTVLWTIGTRDAAFQDYVLAYEAAPVGELRRVVVAVPDPFEMELLCAEDRLIGGGVPELDLWIVRDGREPDLAALKQAARPAKKQWVHPVIETAPWKPYHTWIVDEQVIVTRDARRRQTRLTSYDVATGTELAHRDFDATMGAMCEPGKGGYLLCEIDDDGEITVVDARTLADRLDVAALIRQVAPESEVAQWDPISATDVAIDDKRAVRVDIKKRTAKVVPRPEDRVPRHDPARCRMPLTDPLVVGKTAWEIDQNEDGAILVRREGKTELPPVKLDLYYPSLLGCGPKRDRPHLVSNDSDKAIHVVTALTPSGAVSWTSENLGGHLMELWQIGRTLIVPTDSQARRVVALDAKTGVIRWVATGPLPAPPTRSDDLP